MGTTDDVDARIAASFGCTLTPFGEDREAGAEWPEHMAECPDGNIGAIRLLNRLALSDAQRSANVAAIAQACRGWGSGSAESTARQAQALVQGAIAFKDDDLQIFRPSDLTLARHVGNCVNSARVIASVMQAAGISARCVPVYIGGEIKHTCAQAYIGNAWRWLEGTVTANYDEPPLAAVARGARPCGWPTSETFHPLIGARPAGAGT